MRKGLEECQDRGMGSCVGGLNTGHHLVCLAPYDNQGDRFRARLRMNEGRATVRLTVMVRVSTSVIISG